MRRIPILLAAALLAAGCPSDPTPPDRVPRASAAADRLAGMAPLTVSFTGEALGGDPPALFAWNFGDGETATEAQATHTFVLPGTYAVTLRVTDADGDFDEDSLTVEVTPAPLIVTPAADPTTGRAPLEVQFSTGVQGGVEPYDYEWSFADGSRSTLPAPVHTFAAGGQYDVSVTVTDALRASATGQVKVTVASNDQPAATVSASPTSGIAPLTVAFQGGSTGGNPPMSYSWDFGDGTTGTNQSPSHTYAAPGLFTATLTVLDSDGDSDSRSVEISVTDNSAPSVSVSATPVKGTAPLQVSFTSFVNGGDAPLGFTWVFGDGNTATRQSPTHTYQTAGTFTAVVTVTDANGDADTDQIAIEVGDDQTPTVTATAQPRSGRAPLTVAFTAQAGGGNAPLAFAWDFGDGTTSTVQNPSHTYATAGSFTATVEVTDADGDRDTDSLTVTVAADDQPVVSASASPASGRAPLDVSFFASVQGGDAPLTWQWSFGDGSPSASTQNASHTYAAAGTYTAQVVVTDVDGDADSQTLTIEVSSDSQPTARAFADVTQGIAPLKVNFSSTVTGGDAPFSYAWDFGDGGSGTGDATSHTFQTAGTFTVLLTVTDVNGDADTDSLTINVASNNVPTVSVSAAPTSGAAPLSVLFDATAAGGDAPLTWSWDFGDGGSASVEDPSHTYAVDGVYTATVVVTDVNGDSASASVSILVQASLPDLAVSGLVADVRGDQVVFEVTVTNVGNAPSSSFFVDFYPDRPSAPAPGDFGSFVYQAGLAPSASATVTRTLTRPNGPFTAWAQVDADGNIAESDETNNVVGPLAYEVFGPLVINEVLYDVPGTDSGCFIELYGPPGTSLDGYQLVGINGSNADRYVTIDLGGESLRSDGYFVVAQDATVDPSQVDVVHAGADLQNGSDSLLLEFGGSVIDAVGYGSHAGGESFAGEGSPAPDPNDGRSIGRSHDNADTDDNAADFAILDFPSPGTRNPVTGDTCTYAIPVSASASYDHSTAGAADNYHAQGCGGVDPKTREPDVVYAVSLVAGQTLTAEITAAASGFDTVLYLRSTCLTASTEVACDDDGGTGVLSRLTYTAASGGTYYLVVDGYGAPTDDFGPFSLSIDIQ